MSTLLPNPVSRPECGCGRKMTLKHRNRDGHPFLSCAAWPHGCGRTLNVDDLRGLGEDEDDYVAMETLIGTWVVLHELGVQGCIGRVVAVDPGVNAPSDVFLHVVRPSLEAQIKRAEVTPVIVVGNVLETQWTFWAPRDGELVEVLQDGDLVGRYEVQQVCNVDALAQNESYPVAAANPVSFRLTTVKQTRYFGVQGLRVFGISTKGQLLVGKDAESLEHADFVLDKTLEIRPVLDEEDKPVRAGAIAAKRPSKKKEALDMAMMVNEADRTVRDVGLVRVTATEQKTETTMTTVKTEKKSLREQGGAIAGAVAAGVTMGVTNKAGDVLCDMAGQLFPDNAYVQNALQEPAGREIIKGMMAILLNLGIENGLPVPGGKYVVAATRAQLTFSSALLTGMAMTKLGSQLNELVAIGRQLEELETGTKGALPEDAENAEGPLGDPMVKAARERAARARG